MKGVQRAAASDQVAHHDLHAEHERAVADAALLLAAAHDELRLLIEVVS